MASVAILLQKNVIKSLPSLGYVADPANKTCEKFINVIIEITKQIAHPFDIDIAEASRTGIKSSEITDRTTWANSYLLDILRSTLAMYRDHIYEKHDENGIINCERMIHYINDLFICLESTKKYYNYINSIPPKSDKFQKKNKNQDWKPYPIDIDVENIKTFIRRIAGK